MIKVDFSELVKRANINYKKITEDKSVVIYEDHRTILNVLFFVKAQELENFTPLNIILFDNHDDANEPSSEAKAVIAKFNDSTPSLRDFWSFVEFDLSFQDDDWIKAGMELGLINNVFLFNSSSSKEFSHQYSTERFGVKKVYNLGYIWDILVAPDGKLSGRGSEDFDDKLFWQDFGWERDASTKIFSFKPSQRFIFDIDLDCFSFEVYEKRIAIPKHILAEKLDTKYSSGIYGTQYKSALDLIADFINYSVFSTICFENGCCGGFEESFEIFKMVDHFFYNHKLG